MKKPWSVCAALLSALSVLLAMSSCAEPRRSDESAELSLAECCNTFDFQDVYVEIGIHAQESYYFNNRNEPFYQEFTDFLENTRVSTAENYDADAPDIYMNLFNSKGESLGFSINESDQVRFSGGEQPVVYRCGGIYRDFREKTDSYLAGSARFCRAEATSAQTYEYTVYDQNGAAMKSDSVSREPHLIFIDSDTVHLWVQTGTGALTRWSQFFRVDTGESSPMYHGQTDCFGEWAAVAESGRVCVYRLFSGEPVYQFDTFDEPLADCAENIASVYFSKDGTALAVRYLNEQYMEREQVLAWPVS